MHESDFCRIYITSRFFGDEKVVASMISALAGLSSDWVILVLVGLGMMIAGVIWLILDHCGF